MLKHCSCHSSKPDRIGHVIVSVLASSAVDRSKPKTITLVFSASTLSTHQQGVKAKTG